MTRSDKNKKRRIPGLKTLSIIVASGIIAGSVAFAGCGQNSSASAQTPKFGILTSQNTAGYSVGNTEGSVAQVAESAMKSLVTVSCTSIAQMRTIWGEAAAQEYSSAGSGVIIGKDDTSLYIATNNHVIETADSVTVGFVDGTEAAATVKGTDPSTDLAVIEVPLESISQETMDAIAVATIGNSDELVLGDQVVAIGNALGYGQSVTSGYVSAFDRSLDLTYQSGDSFTSEGLIQTDASINSGNSGGGLFNMKGELIAINEAKTSGSNGVAVDNMGFAIPMSKAAPILQSLIDGTAVQHESTSGGAFLGINISEITEEASQMYNMPMGVFVSAVQEGSPAASAGIIEGDIITALDDTAVTSFDGLKAALAGKSSGDTAVITLYRTTNGVYQPVNIPVVLG